MRGGWRSWACDSAPQFARTPCSSWLSFAGQPLGTPTLWMRTKLVLKQLPLITYCSSLSYWSIFSQWTLSSLRAGWHRPGPRDLEQSPKWMCVEGRGAVTVPCSKPLRVRCRPPPPYRPFFLPFPLPCIAHATLVPTHAGLCAVSTRALHRQLLELCSPSATCPCVSQDGLR